MKKIVLFFTMGFYFSFGVLCAYATFDDNTKNENKAYGGDAYQKQDQGQLQGQAQGQLSKQANSQSSSIGGDKTKVTATSYPDLSSTKGKDESQIGSPYAIIGNNVESPRVRFQHQLMILDNLYMKDIITEEEYKKEYKIIYTQLSIANKETRAFGVIPVCKNPILKNTVCW